MYFTFICFNCILRLFTGNQQLFLIGKSRCKQVHVSTFRQLQAFSQLGYAGRKITYCEVGLLFRSYQLFKFFLVETAAIGNAELASGKVRYILVGSIKMTVGVQFLSLYIDETLRKAPAFRMDALGSYKYVFNVGVYGHVCSFSCWRVNRSF